MIKSLFAKQSQVYHGLKCISVQLPDIFDMFVWLLSSAVEKNAPLKKVILTKKTPKLLKKPGSKMTAKICMLKPTCL